MTYRTCITYPYLLPIASYTHCINTVVSCVARDTLMQAIAVSYTPTPAPLSRCSTTNEVIQCSLLNLYVACIIRMCLRVMYTREALLFITICKYTCIYLYHHISHKTRNFVIKCKPNVNFYQFISIFSSNFCLFILLFT